MSEGNDWLERVGRRIRRLWFGLLWRRLTLALGAGALCGGVLVIAARLAGWSISDAVPFVLGACALVLEAAHGAASGASPRDLVWALDRRLNAQQALATCLEGASGRGAGLRSLLDASVRRDFDPRTLSRRMPYPERGWFGVLAGAVAIVAVALQLPPPEPSGGLQEKSVVAALLDRALSRMTQAGVDSETSASVQALRDHVQDERKDRAGVAGRLEAVARELRRQERQAALGERISELLQRSRQGGEAVSEQEQEELLRLVSEYLCEARRGAREETRMEELACALEAADREGIGAAWRAQGEAKGDRMAELAEAARTLETAVALLDPARRSARSETRRVTPELPEEWEAPGESGATEWTEEVVAFQRERAQALRTPSWPARYDEAIARYFMRNR